MRGKITEVPALAETKQSTVAIDATMETLKEGVAKATAGVETTQTKVKENMEKTMRTAEDLMAFNQGNLEAMIKAGQIWTSGFQDLSRHIAAAAQASIDDTINTFKALSGVRSLKDAMELQSAYARSALEKGMSESGKLTDASFRLTEQAMAPLTARVSLAVEKFAKAA